MGREQERRVPVALQLNTSPGMGAAPGQPCKTAARDKTYTGSRLCPQPRQPGQRERASLHPREPVPNFKEMQTRAREQQELLEIWRPEHSNHQPACS